MVGSSRPGLAAVMSSSERSERLLEHFQQRIGRVAVHLVGAVDNDDAPAALGRRQMEEIADLAHVADHDLAATSVSLWVVSSFD